MAVQRKALAFPPLIPFLPLLFLGRADQVSSSLSLSTSLFLGIFTSLPSSLRKSSSLIPLRFYLRHHVADSDVNHHDAVVEEDRYANLLLDSGGHVANGDDTMIARQTWIKD